MSKTKIIYKDIAPGSAEAATTSAVNVDPVSDTSLVPLGAETPAISTLEHNLWGLGGNFELIDNQPIAFWSKEISSEGGTFEESPIITLAFSQQFSSVGVTIYFDTATGDYCDSVNIKWYQQDVLKSDMDFQPDNAVYFCENTVEAYDKVIITLNKTRIPGRRAKVNQILMGIIREYDMREIRDADITVEISLMSTDLPASNLTWTLDSRKMVDFMFQARQPMEAWTNNSLIGVYYVERADRYSANVYKIDAQDAIGVLEDTVFSGGVYTAYSAQQLVKDIIGSMFQIVFDKEDIALTGAVMSGTKRQALQQVLFAWGACITTFGVDGIRIFDLDETIKAIDTYHTYTGPAVEMETMITEVQVTTHTYTQSSSGNVEIGGKKYNDTQNVYTVTNPNTTANTKDNVIQITDATLISPNIGQATAQRVYDYYQRRKTAKGKIVWDNEVVGDLISLPNPWGASTAGNISKMNIILSNTVAANIELKGV